MSQNQIDGLKHQIKNEEEKQRVGTLINKLMANSEFKQVVLDLYFGSESARLVMLLGSPACDAKTREATIRQMDGIAQFAEFLRCRKLEAEQAEGVINSAREQIQSLLTNPEDE